MDFLPGHISEYIESHTRRPSELLSALDRETHLKISLPQMLSGHLQGQALRLFSFMIQPKYVLEIGTYTGYSALCMAEGVQDSGKLVTIDINEELEDMVRGYFAKSEQGQKIDFRIGNALDIIPALTYTFDLVFIDADKANYSSYYDLVWEKLRPGGFIIADNVLWSGKVTQPKPDKDTQALMAFNEKVHADERAENVLLPIRDGLMVIRKKD
ncbi:MAG: O-methyltransferase [Bacteroidota bacterium]|nr:O-methyltransferase [Bacteroidota bacterium]